MYDPGFGLELGLAYVLSNPNAACMTMLLLLTILMLSTILSKVSVDGGVEWSVQVNLATAHNNALPEGSPLRFCSQYAAGNNIVVAGGSEGWMESGYTSLLRVSATDALVCYVRETEHSLPGQYQPPPACREDGPVFCMRMEVLV
jgi:hypothetical protein